MKTIVVLPTVAALTQQTIVAVAMLTIAMILTMAVMITIAVMLNVTTPLTIAALQNIANYGSTYTANYRCITIFSCIVNCS